MIQRRAFLTGLVAATVAAPAIVRPLSLMKINPRLAYPIDVHALTLDEYVERIVAPRYLKYLECETEALQERIAACVMQNSRYGGSSLLVRSFA